AQLADSHTWSMAQELSRSLEAKLQKSAMAAGVDDNCSICSPDLSDITVSVDVHRVTSKDPGSRASSKNSNHNSYQLGLVDKTTTMSSSRASSKLKRADTTADDLSQAMEQSVRKELMTAAVAQESASFSEANPDDSKCAQGVPQVSHRLIRQAVAARQFDLFFA
ncbi:unnamed protein product, partial [Polarella glacialis]